MGSDVRNYVSVVVIKDGVIAENYLFVGKNDNTIDQAEAKFVALASEYGLPADEQEEALDNGYYELPLSSGAINGSVCISWPSVTDSLVHADDEE